MIMIVDEQLLDSVLLFVIISFTIAWLIVTDIYHGRSNSMQYHYSHSHSGSFTDSFIQDNMETHVQKIINIGIT